MTQNNISYRTETEEVLPPKEKFFIRLEKNYSLYKKDYRRIKPSIRIFFDFSEFFGSIIVASILFTLLSGSIYLIVQIVELLCHCVIHYPKVMIGISIPAVIGSFIFYRYWKYNQDYKSYWRLN